MVEGCSCSSDSWPCLSLRCLEHILTVPLSLWTGSLVPNARTRSARSAFLFFFALSPTRKPVQRKVAWSWPSLTMYWKSKARTTKNHERRSPARCWHTAFRSSPQRERSLELANRRAESWITVSILLINKRSIAWQIDIFSLLPYGGGGYSTRNSAQVLNKIFKT